MSETDATPPAPRTAASAAEVGAVAVALKSVDLRPDVDSLTGVVTTDPRWAGLSAADGAALETGLRLGERWGAPVIALLAGSPADEGVLRRALAVGAGRAVRVALPAGASSAVVGRALADAVKACGATVVVCGAFSLDRGSGSVPAFLAHHLGAAQALGLVAVEPTGPAEPSPSVVATRRLDGGRRERLRIGSPAVLSVEGSVARLRRAGLAASIAAETAPLEVIDAPTGASAAGSTTAEPGVDRRAYRPRARALDAPHGTALQRILELTDAATPRTPPRLVELEPDAAAAEILDQLRAWGELPEPGPANGA